MKICLPDIDMVFDTEQEQINSLVVENPKVLYRILEDIQSQLVGDEGQVVVSRDNKILDISKNVELIDRFVPFEVNSKTIVNRACALLEKKAMEPDYYMQTMDMLSVVERVLSDLSFDMTGDIYFEKIDIANIIKAGGLHFNIDYDSLGEKLIDYMQLVREYDKDKLFILYNLRGIMDDAEIEAFYDTCLCQEFHVFCIESFVHIKQKKENQYIIDYDLCEICS